MIVFIDIPHTGGRAFEMILRASYDSDAGRLYPPPPHDTMLPADQMDQLGVYFNGLRSFSSPVVRRLPSVEAQWPGAAFMSLLCHPVTRLLHSYGHMMQRLRAGIQALPDGLNAFMTSPVAFARRPAHINYLTRTFSNADAWEPIGDAHLDRALMALGQLDYVLIGEHLELSLQPAFRSYPELRDSYIAAGTSLAPHATPVYAEADFPAADVSEIMALNALDMQLYSAAFERACGYPAPAWPSRTRATP